MSNQQNAVLNSFFSKLAALSDVDPDDVLFDGARVTMRGSADGVLACEEGIFRSIELDAAQNILEDVAYDQLHGVNTTSSIQLASRYIELAADEDTADLDMLEIGCGTGLLTTGLAQSDRIGLCVSIDISRAFLKMTQARVAAAGAAPRTVLLCADLNSLPFAPGSFDAVVGNSILHHIYDYEMLLENLGRFLRPGGRMIFSEPCQQGKSLVSFFLAAIAAFDVRQPEPYFTDAERGHIAAIQSIHKRELAALRDPTVKLKWEDKHIFDTRKLAAAAARLGFSGFTHVNTNKITDGFRTQAQRSLAMRGVTKSLEPFDFIFQSFQKEYMPLLGSSVETPHQFLIFEK